MNATYRWIQPNENRKKYVDAVLGKLAPENIHLDTEITEVRSVDDGVEMVEAGGKRHLYDHVILALVSPSAKHLPSLIGLFEWPFG